MVEGGWSEHSIRSQGGLRPMVPALGAPHGGRALFSSFMVVWFTVAWFTVVWQIHAAAVWATAQS